MAAQASSDNQNSERDILKASCLSADSLNQCPHQFSSGWLGLDPKAQAALKYLGLRFSGLLWGHGERPLLLLVSAAFFVVALSFINLWAVLPSIGWEATGSGLKVLGYCFEQFWGARPDMRFRGYLFIDYALIGLRYLYIGLFISVLFKSISHR